MIFCPNGKDNVAAAAHSNTDWLLLNRPTFSIIPASRVTIFFRFVSVFDELAS